MNAFESAEEQDKLLTIIDKFNRVYPDIWKGIGFPDATETSGEVSNQPMTDPDLDLLETGWRELKELNHDFLSMALSRAKELIDRELANS